VSRWKEHASAVSVTGACVFATVTGATAVFAGAWWGQHHGPVVVRYAPRPAGPARAHAARAGGAVRGTVPQPVPGAGGTGIRAQPDSKVGRASAASPPHPAAVRGRIVKQAAGPASAPSAGPPTDSVPASPTVAGTGPASSPAGPPASATPPAPSAAPGAAVRSGTPARPNGMTAGG
jgi:hypothetical protein